MKNITHLAYALACLFYFLGCKESTPVISLAGEWSFSLDSTDIGIAEKWYNRSLEETVTLPGSMNTNGKGYPVTAETPWTGSMWNRAWYESPDYAKYCNPQDTNIS